MRALSGRPSVYRSTSTLSIDGWKGNVRNASPWMGIADDVHSSDGAVEVGTALAVRGNSIWPMLRTATELGPRGVLMTALKGRNWPSSTNTRIFCGALFGPCQSSMSASIGRPSELSVTCTCSTNGFWYDQVLSEPPCTICDEPPLVGTTLPR
eukprot:6366671-Prymnesium_polylepis.1